MANLPNPNESATSPLPNVPAFPPNETGKQATPDEVKQRLNWGEPGLTIIDARSHEAFRNERITGAVSMPLGQIPQASEDMLLLEYERDIYIYADDNEQTVEAANQLRQSGYQNVAELQGGLNGWKAIGGPTEGIYAFASSS